MTNSRRAFDRPVNQSKCHDAVIDSCAIMVIQENGTESEVGKIYYCSQDGWINESSGRGKRVRCFATILVKLSPDCPVSESQARNLFDHQVPTYWLSYAYHLTKNKKGDWSTIRGDGFPYIDFDKAVPAVRSLLRFKDFYPTPKRTSGEEAEDAPPAAAPKKASATKDSELPADYKSKAAGDTDDEEYISFA